MESGLVANSMTEEKARRRAELDELRRVMAELPIESPDDGFSGTDHDQLLYNLSAFSLITRMEGDDLESPLNPEIRNG